MASDTRENAKIRKVDSQLSDVAALALQKVAAGRLSMDEAGAGTDMFPFFQSIVGARIYDGLDQTIARLAEAKVSSEMVLERLIPQMAALIGDQWLEDEMSWSSVTIISSRLQSLAWRLIEPAMLDISADRDAPKVLMISPEGETHTLGCVLAIGELIREGVNTVGVFGEPDEDVFERLRGGDFDAVGVSTSGCTGKEHLLQLIEGLQSHAGDAVLAIGGSITTCNPQLVDELRGDSHNMQAESLTTLLQTGLTKGRRAARKGSQAAALDHPAA